MSDLDTVMWAETARRDATSDDHGRIACTIDDRDHTVRYTVWSYAGHHAVERVVLHRAGFDDERMRADVAAGVATKLADYYASDTVTTARYEPLGSLAQALRAIADDLDEQRRRVSMR